MFCDLNGATAIPRREYARHKPVVINDLPASELVPATRMPATVGESRWSRFGPVHGADTGPQGGGAVFVHLVRHGQSTWNVQGRVQGQTAHPRLTARGRQQAARAAAELASLCDADTSLWSSDLERAVESARLVGARLGLGVRLDRDLREQHLGDMQGRLARDLRAEPTPEGLHVSDVRWAGGESMKDVHERVGRFFGAVAPTAGRHLVVVSHGDTIRVALAWLQGRDHRQVDWCPVDNGQVITLTRSVPSPPGGRLAGSWAASAC